MSYENAGICWSSKQLKGMILNGKIDLDHPIQRSLVWEKSRKTAMIESMILSIPFQHIYAKRVVNKDGEKIYSIMDGKQRLSTIKQFLSDEFALTEIPPVTYMNEETGEMETADITGKKFSELPEPLRDFLNAFTFNIRYFDNLTREEEVELFKRLNNGKPLSTKSRTLASCLNLEEMLDIGKHPIFSEMLSEKARENKDQVTVVMKTWCMLNKDIKTVSFESRVFNPLLEKTEVTDAEKFTLAKVFDKALEIHDAVMEQDKKAARWMYKETHFISLIPFIKKAVEDDMEPKMMADWIVEFFNSPKESYDYASGSGSASPSNIQGRNNVLSVSYSSFFKAE